MMPLKRNNDRVAQSLHGRERTVQQLASRESSKAGWELIADTVPYAANAVLTMLVQ